MTENAVQLQMQKLCSVPCNFGSLTMHGLVLSLRESAMPDTRPEWEQV